jgi:hypothetical protein
MASSTKEQVIEAIRRLPDQVTLEEIMAELFFRRKVDEGLAQLDAGEGVEHDAAKQQLSKWLS